MSINITKCKRVRLLWNEYLQNSTKLYPYISFDDGDSWMDVSDVVDMFRDGDYNNKYDYYQGVKTKNSNTGTTSMDISFGFTPLAIPKIEKVESFIDSNGSYVAGTYYFAAMCINYDFVGLDEVVGNYGSSSQTIASNIISDKAHAYYDGMINTATNNPYISDIKKLVITDTGNHSVNIYVNYPKCVGGVLIYMGTDPKNLYLRYITNISQKLNTTLDNSATTVVLKHKYPLPTPSGIIKIDGEYMKYSSMSFDSNTYKLTVSRGTSATSHQENATVYYCWEDSNNPGSYQYSIPNKIYAFPNISGMLEYINFNGKSAKDTTEMNTPSTIGSMEYSEYLSMYQYCLKFNGSNVVLTNLIDSNLSTLLSNGTGSVHFYVCLTDFMASSSEDPCIFYPQYGSSGLFCKISRANKKIYVGYVNAVLDETTGKYTYSDEDAYIIYSHDDYRIPVVTSNGMDSIGISWEKDTDGNLIFYLSINSYVNLQFKSNLNYTLFTLGKSVIGGKYDSDTGKTSCTFIGYFDDWRVYKSNLAIIYTPYEERDIGYTGNNSTYKYMDTTYGISSKSNSTTINNAVLNFIKTLSNKTITSIKDGYIVSIVLTDTNATQKYIRLTGKNFQGVTVSTWKPYTRSKTFNDIDTELKTDTDIYACKIKLTGKEVNYNNTYNGDDSNHLIDYGNTTTKLATWTLTTSTTASEGDYSLYYPKLHTALIFTTSIYSDSNDNPSRLIYDNWAIKSYVLGNSTSTLNYTYPVFPTTIQIKYVLKNEGNIDGATTGADTSGFTTPVLSGPAAIVSEMTIS